MSTAKHGTTDNYSTADRIVNYIKENACRGDPESVIQTGDDFCKKFSVRSMHIGETKGSCVDAIIVEQKPKVALELGAFWGYSAVRFARLLDPGSKYISIEFDERFLQYAKDLVEFAGLCDRVVFINGSSEVIIPKLKDDYEVDVIDFVLVDHDKRLYKPDIIRLHENGLLRKGSVVAADNALFPDVANYLEYVRNSPKFSSALLVETNSKNRPAGRGGTL